MKHWSNYGRPMAFLYLTISFISMLIIMEIICFLTFFPLIESHGWRTTASIIWLYLGTFVFYKVTRKYTNGGKDWKIKKKSNRCGGNT